MVKLEAVEDEAFQQQQAAAAGKAVLEDDDDNYSDTDSEISEEDVDELEESLAERILALKDMIPPKQRARLVSAANGIYSVISSVASFGGKSLWVVSTSVLMLGVPFAIAVADETQVVEMEKEMKAQQIASNSLSAGQAQALDGHTKP